MANYKEHISTGAALGAIGGFLLSVYNQNNRILKGEQTEVDWSKVLGHTVLGLGAGAVGGVLPDLLEPAYHPHHRKIFHSVGAATALGFALKKVRSSDLDEDVKHAINYTSIGYFSHLLLDMETARGLPVL